MQKKIKSIHFVGIKGVGMAPLSIIAKEAGFKVSGSDLAEKFITDEALIKSNIEILPFSKENVKGKDLVITTGAHGGYENAEVKEAFLLGIPVWSKGQAVGEFMKGDILRRKFSGISVAGSHGKTTTTAMVSTILKSNNLDPTYIIGTGWIKSLGKPGHLGKGLYFITESDEYATEPVHDKTPQFLWQEPQFEIFTNIELDHPDIYESVDKVREAFFNFTDKLKDNGLLICNGDDPQVRLLLKEYKKRVVTFGFSPNNDFYITKNRTFNNQTFFWVEGKTAKFGDFVINIAGRYNALNALASIIVALELGLSLDKIKQGLVLFEGSKRRFEYIGKSSSGFLLYDDYAHHPTEIKSALEAFKETFPNKKIVCIYQPHTYSRTEKLFEQFISSFSNANTVIIIDTFSSFRNESESLASSEELAREISKVHKDALFLPGQDDVIKYVEQKGYRDDTVVVTMGAGDVYKIGYKLLG